MRTTPYGLLYIFPILAVFLLEPEVVSAQTEPLPPPEIQATPLPSPDPPPLLPAQEETIRQLVDKEIDSSQAISNRIDEKVHDTFGWTIDLLNLLIAVLIAIPIGTGFVLWWLRQSVIDRLVSDIRKQFQQEAEQLIKQQLEQEVTARLQQQIEASELELKQLRAEFEQRLDHLYRDAEANKTQIVLELEQLLASVGQEDTAPPPIERRLRQLTDQLESIKAGSHHVEFSATDYLKEGEAFYLGRSYDDAVASYQAALAINPDLIDAWLGLAKTLRRMGRYADAVAANDEIIQRQPHNPWGWFGKGYSLSDMQQYEAALNAYDKATQLEPNRSTFWKNKGYVLTKLHRYPEAMDCFDKALYIKPQSPSALYWKAYGYAAQGQIDEAITALQAAIARRPDLRESARTDPDFDGLRSTKAFQHLLAASY
ncbi:MAG: tetratricopeptide repeat protein [Leptolyngbya sp. IPPAS B-1204]|nr:tetratricopeptide repeat protein [Elainella sp. C42_A2020_010]RNJ69076.1 MAG: tetratricopeptide repeat protein [Leptolyngbya sp. IPPAS B-1204]